jgi:hypothetical protein
MYIFALVKNLISICKTTKQGQNNISFFHDHCKFFNLFTKMGEITITSHQKTSLYLVGVQFKPNNMANCLTMVTTCNNNSSSITWHHKLGHLHYEALKNSSNPIWSLDCLMYYNKFHNVKGVF